jgi:hypothetical protein
MLLELKHALLKKVIKCHVKNFNSYKMLEL